MDADQVIAILDQLEAEGIDVWVDGGWAVDALLNRQTRDHNDLDIVIPRSQLPVFNVIMTAIGFVESVRHTDFNWEMVDQDGYLVDIHVVDFTETVTDRFGIEVYGGQGLEYEVGSLTGTGVINGRTVQCCHAEVLMRYHTGYEPAESDFHDTKLLNLAFGIPMPWPFDLNGDRTNWTRRFED
jgi:lincosamide nucleotidyltransferase A/C/D/E